MYLTYLGQTYQIFEHVLGYFEVYSDNPNFTIKIYSSIAAFIYDIKMVTV